MGKIDFTDLIGQALPSSERRVFDHHPPRSRRREGEHEQVRAVVKAAAGEMYRVMPSCIERDYMLKALREALMWANAGIALAEDPHAEPEGQPDAQGKEGKGGELRE